MYIRATSIISPQASFQQLLDLPNGINGNRLTAIEPDYGMLIDAKMIRRMSRVIKMGVAAALQCLKEAGVSLPAAIITGTAYGCLADTDLFLTKMIENEEDLLTPTSFIQSTHNTVAAQIALILKCHSYNNTFVQRGFSFENALLDAISFAVDEMADTVLVGAVDEITNTSHRLLTRFGLYKNNSSNSLQLLTERSKGTIAGEGAAFFLLSQSASGNDYAKLQGLHTIYKPTDDQVIIDNIISFLASQSIALNEIDLVILGNNGDTSNDQIYHQLGRTLFNGKRVIGYKHLCGEYPTSSGFALWYAANMLKTKLLPGVDNNHTMSCLKNILIYNHYQHSYHALYLLGAC